MSIKIKICGLKQAEDARYAAQAGAAAIGLIFHSASPRNLSLRDAASIRTSLPPFTSAVAVVSNQPTAFVTEIIQVVKPDFLQFHGDEAEEFCASFKVPYIKSIRAFSQRNILHQSASYPSAAAFLLDTAATATDEYGGSGRVFDWRQIPPKLSKPMIVAGGLTPDNIAQLLRGCNPYAVDVSSGVESSPGIKDQKKINDFIANACCASEEADIA